MDDTNYYENMIAELRSERDALVADLAAARALLRELVALVRGECPSLLHEDSGGDAKLACDGDEALKETS